MLAFIVFATLAAALLFGVLPAWQAANTDVGNTLKEQMRGATGSRRQMRSGRALVSLQLAMSLPLLVGAGLLVRTVYNLQRADLGFNPERLMLTRVDLREAGYEGTRRDTIIRTLRDQLRQTPGVPAVSFSQLSIFSGVEAFASIDVEGYTPKSDRDRGSALDYVGPHYFATLGIPLTLGRDFLDSDRDGSPMVCIVNESFARLFFEGRNPIGLRVSTAEDGRERVTYQVVGVARNAHTQGLRGDVKPRYFVAGLQHLPQMRNPTFADPYGCGHVGHGPDRSTNDRTCGRLSSDPVAQFSRRRNDPPHRAG